MKKLILLFSLLTLLNAVTFAKRVDERTAKKVGLTFLTNTSNSQLLKNSVNLELVYQAYSNSSISNLLIDQTTYFYVFNVDNQGFVIVSGEDNVIPILAYSDEGIFDPNNIPPNTRKWLEEYKNQIRNVITNNISATTEIRKEWKNYIYGSTPSFTKAITSVNPLVMTKWSQSPYYNALCPSGTPTGCVATAMAQIMKFWNYPATGSGFHSYNHQTYGTLSANFGSTTYQWGSMPNTVNSSNSAVATLMYQAGVSVDMDYGPQASGAYVISAKSPIQHCSEYALKTYFGYKSTLQGVERINYNQTQWINLLKIELNAGRPILYAGLGSVGGHAFVCDGFDNSDFFHFNWGWGGSYDGYFSVNSLNPGGYGFNSGHQALIGIEPPSGSQTYNMELYDYVTPSQSTIYFGQAFNISTNIFNNGATNFYGDYCAAVFDNEYNFIDYVEIKTGYSLEAGYVYTNNLIFQNTGLFSMLPGTYYIGVFYKPTGHNWIQVSNSGNYTNMIQMNVINPNDIELNSPIVVSPSTTLVQGQPASVNLNIINDGAATFYGQYQVNLYNLDGTFVETINTIYENEGLPHNYTYQSPYLTFPTNLISAAPGTYLLAAIHKPNGSSNWQLTGSSYYQNPVRVTIQAPSYSPDIYENNNTLNQAFALSISFSGNTTTKNTVGSNFHIGTDYDFYKINLSSGYDYTISARLHDSYNSGNGNTYSADGLFTYSTNGSTWSDTYDDIMPNNINIQNGGTIYFHVAPYFEGGTGTYLLTMTITRTQNSVGIEETEFSDLLKVYPNPAKEFVTIDLNQVTEKANLITLFNIQGQLVSSVNISNSENILQLPLQNFSEGIYFIQVHTSQSILTKKIIIKK